MFKCRRKKIVRGRNVYLFEPSKECGPEFVEMTTSSRDFHNPWIYPATDLRRFKSYLDRINKGHTHGFFVGQQSDDSLVGVINVNDVVMGGFCSGSLGYFVDHRYMCQGYMTEALTLVLEQAFNNLELHRLEANVRPGNEASLALIKKLGFQKEGFSPSFLLIDGKWRDHERWAILAHDWFTICHKL